MDNISEQLIKITKTAKDRLAVCFIWLFAFLLVFVLVLIAMKNATFISLIILFIAGVMYGGYKLTSLFDIEYEYIVVNKDLDIDKIVAKSNRKRLVTVKLNEVQEFGLYDDEAKKKLANRTFDNKFVCCNAYDEAYYVVVNHSKKGMVLVIAAMNERTRTEALKSIPRAAR